MNEDFILSLLEKRGVIIKGTHVVLTSGRHSDVYVNKDAIYPYGRELSLVCKSIAQGFLDMDVDIDVVVGPALGGIILSQWVAYHFYRLTSKQVLSVFAEKTSDGKSFALTRGYDKIVSGKDVLVVEDVVTTGGSVKKVIEAVLSSGGNVVGVGVVCNRGGEVAREFVGAPIFYALLDMTIESWDEKDCPLCRAGLPINTDIGKGREYHLKKKEKHG